MSAATLDAAAPRALRWSGRRRSRRQAAVRAPVRDAELARLRAEVDRWFFLPPPRVL